MRLRLLFLLGSAAFALAAATAALAGTLLITATVSGTAGVSMSLPGSPSLSHTLNGTDQVVSWSAPLGIVDARGTGAGWNLTVSVVTFADESGHSLAPGSATAVGATCEGGNTCAAAANAIAYPITIGTTAAKFFNAPAGTGLGRVTITPSMKVVIPGNAYAGAYSATVSLATATSP